MKWNESLTFHVQLYYRCHQRIGKETETLATFELYLLKTEVDAKEFIRISPRSLLLAFIVVAHTKSFHE
jgi:hypothetical protein